MPRFAIPLILAALTLLAPAAAQAAAPPPGATHEEVFFENPADGTTLHADILRPKDLPKDAETPVILTVSPYTNHSGQPATPDLEGGPSSRFYDFMELGKTFEKGYTWVYVDLRGTGGSGGCNDWGGPGEQSDVKAAVEWAASQSWSTGKVALFGKSYDAWTGLMGLAQRPQGLAAVIAMEPVVDGYRYLYMNRVPFTNKEQTPALFTVIDHQPGHPADDPRYQVNSAPNTPCRAENFAQQQESDSNTEFWKQRNLIEAVKGNRTPTFFTQGYLESNTKPDAVFQLWNNLSGPNHAWFGQFDHVRGYERDADTNQSLTGRETFVDEAMRFLDHHVRGLPLAQAPTDRDPVVTVQDAGGRWRGEPVWPPADSTAFGSALLSGSYADSGENNGTAEGGGTTGNGVWTFSQRLPHAAHLAGTPRVALDLETSAPDANLVVNVYDVAPDREATLISRGGFLVPGSGRHAFELYGQDWVVPAGHRIGVLVTHANDDWFNHRDSGADVTVKGGRVDLPFLRFRRESDLDGASNPRLRQYLREAPFVVAEDVFEERRATFDLPPALAERAAGGGAPGGGAIAGTGTGRRAERLTARLHAFRARRGTRRIVVQGLAPRRTRVVVQLKRNGKTLKTRRLAPKELRRYRVQFKRVPRAGRYRAVVRALSGTGVARATTRLRRLR